MMKIGKFFNGLRDGLFHMLFVRESYLYILTIWTNNYSNDSLILSLDLGKTLRRHRRKNSQSFSARTLNRHHRAPR